MRLILRARDERAARKKTAKACTPQGTAHTPFRQLPVAVTKTPESMTSGNPLRPVATSCYYRR
jgi:hypothetical protein